MNSVDFIFIIIFRFLQKRGYDGRIGASGFMGSSIAMLAGIIFYPFNNLFKLVKFRDYGTYAANKYSWYPFIFVFIISLFFIYNQERIKRLRKEYYKLYGNNTSINHGVITILILIIPVLTAMTIGILKSKGLLPNNLHENKKA